MTHHNAVAFEMTTTLPNNQLKKAGHDDRLIFLLGRPESKQPIEKPF